MAFTILMKAMQLAYLKHFFQYPNYEIIFTFLVKANIEDHPNHIDSFIGDIWVEILETDISLDKFPNLRRSGYRTTDSAGNQGVTRGKKNLGPKTETFLVEEESV